MTGQNKQPKQAELKVLESLGKQKEECKRLVRPANELQQNKRYYCIHVNAF